MDDVGTGNAVVLQALIHKVLIRVVHDKPCPSPSCELGCPLQLFSAQQHSCTEFHHETEGQMKSFSCHCQAGTYLMRIDPFNYCNVGHKSMHRHFYVAI